MSEQKGEYKVRVDVLPITDGATPDPQNVNKHTQRGQTLLQNSLRKRGAFRSIASAGKDAETPVIYAGNLTHEMAVDAGFTEIVNVHVTGNQLVNVVRDDIAPGSPEAIALGIEDNQIGKESYQPDIDALAALASGENAVLAVLRQEDKLFDSMVKDMSLSVYGDTSTDRDKQGVSSTWDQVDSSEFQSVKIGQIETRIEVELYEKLYNYLGGKFDIEKIPVNVSFSELLSNALLDS